MIADDIASEEDQKFQSFLEGDQLKAYARHLFAERVAAIRPSTAVTIAPSTPAADGSRPPPPTAAAAATTGGGAPAQLAVDLVRDMLVVYAMTCDVFHYFNAFTKSIFKKKPPELAKPLFADVKRAITLSHGSAAAGGGGGTTGSAVLPPIGKRWMIATEFAAFAHQLLTSKFYSTEEESGGAASPPPIASPNAASAAAATAAQ